MIVHRVGIRFKVSVVCLVMLAHIFSRRHILSLKHSRQILCVCKQTIPWKNAKTVTEGQDLFLATKDACFYLTTQATSL